jgi:hypothetical protein
VKATFDPNDRRSSSFPTERMLEEVLAEIESAIDDVRFGILDRSEPDPKKRKRGLSAFDLVQRTRSGSGDGFPRSSGVGGGGQRSSDYSIVESTVERRLDHGEAGDPVKAFWAMWNDLIEMRKAGRSAVQKLADATPPVAAPGDPSCRCCGNLVVYALERCRWCYEWHRTEGSDPPASILQARQDGRRITTKLVAEAEAAVALQARQRKKRRR